MVYLATSEEWQRQSALLLQARPSTTRVTTKYKIPNLDSPKYQTKKRKRDGDTESKNDAGPRVPKAALVLKTYDPESGVVLKFKTDRAAEVGRLVAGLGRLGRYMAALPEKTETLPDVVMEDSATTQPTSGTATPAPMKDATPTAADSKPQHAAGGGAGGGAKKKKKGKK